MKATRLLVISVILFMQSISLLQGQKTEGTDFWLTFGKNANNLSSPTALIFQIRIVGSSKQTEGRIYFTNLGTYIDFTVNSNGVYDLDLNLYQRIASYNTVTGKTNYSIHITTDNPVSVFAFNDWSGYIHDVTNVLPVEALGKDYYHISYTRYVPNNPPYWDAYAVIATKNNTQLYHNGVLAETLNAGEVYYRTSDTDMTGSLITTTNPVAFFAVHQGTMIPPQPPTLNYSILFQQLAPINTWGNKFFVPVSVMDKDIVRIVAAQNGTNITQTGGTIRTGIPGAQENLTGLQAGQFVELDIYLSQNGCFIESNRPVGVCTYIRSFQDLFQLVCSPAQCWIPAVDQKIAYSLMAPFISIANIYAIFYALVVTPTATQNDTKVSIGGFPPTNLTGGIWYDNVTAGMSFYSFKLTEKNKSYIFSNPNGLLVYGYSHGDMSVPSTYYVLAGSAMRDLDAAFYANDIHFQELKENPFCTGMVDFRAVINGLHPTHPQRIRWYVDGAMEPGTLNQETWSKTFAPAEYEIRMEVVFENNATATKIGTLKIISCNHSAEFFANDIPSALLQNNTICNKTGKVDFRAEIEGIHPEAGSLKWFIDKNDGNGFQEELTAQDQKTWSKTFETGTYQIKMWVRYDNGDIVEKIGTLKIEIFWLKMQNVRH